MFFDDISLVYFWVSSICVLIFILISVFKNCIVTCLVSFIGCCYIEINVFKLAYYLNNWLNSEGKVTAQFQCSLFFPHGIVMLIILQEQNKTKKPSIKSRILLSCRKEKVWLYSTANKTGRPKCSLAQVVKLCTHLKLLSPWIS